MPGKSRAPSIRPSTTLRRVAFARWAWRGPRVMAMAVCGRVALVRSASRGREGNHRHRAGNGCQDQDGHGRCVGHCQGDRQKARHGANILDASSLGDVKKQESAEVAESIEKADGFAQVFPEHKYHIVDVLQRRGHIVGMTGDGVNDAPALKKADCGIAVSDATDAARAAAAIVLMTPGLSVIIDAIKESRRIFQRMNSYAIYRIAETLRVLFFMTLAILIFNFYPLTAVMIVMLALLNDGAILSIAYDNVHYKDQPEAWNMRMVLGISTVLGSHRCGRRIWPVLPRGARVSSGPRARPDHDVPEAVGGGTSDNIPDTDTGAILVDPTRTDTLDRGARYPNRCDAVCGLRLFDDTAGLGMGASSGDMPWRGFC